MAGKSGTPWYAKIRGVTVLQDGEPVAGGGRVSALDFLDSILDYDEETGTVTIQVGATFQAFAVETLTGAANTLALTQQQKFLGISHTSATTLTVPANATVAFPVGTTIMVMQAGVGRLAVAAALGVTIRSAAGLKARAQYSALRLYKIATNEWVLDGDLATDTVSVLASNASTFDIPNSGTYGSPTGMSVTFGQCYAGDRFLIDAWAQITEGGGNAREVTSRLWLDGATLITTQALEVGANGVIHFASKYLHTLASDNADPEFAAAYLADGAGPDVTAGAISVTRIQA
jgi:hypothetical protein